MIKPFKNQIKTNTTTTPIATNCTVYQVVIAVAAAGTTWKLRIQDKGSPATVLIPETTLALPSTPTPVIVNFNFPLPMQGGIDIITPSGTPGEVGVWIVADDGT